MFVIKAYDCRGKLMAQGCRNTLSGADKLQQFYLGMRRVGVVVMEATSQTLYRGFHGL